MTQLHEAQISRAILASYSRKLDEHLISDVLIVGAGPAGLTAAYHLAGQGLKVAMIEKRLAPGGGIWGGAMGMNQVVIQEEALTVLRDLDVRHHAASEGLYVVDATELACALCLRALRSGAAMFNLVTVEDISIHENAVTGAVINRTMISGALPVDPITMLARAVIDGTGHEAAVVQHVRRRGLLGESASPCEGPMNATAGENFVVDRVAEVFPGLWVCGMAVCATFAGPRMGPIFGGMLLSGCRVAERVASRLRERL